MIATKCMLGSGCKIVALRLCRDIQTTKVLAFRVTDDKSRRAGSRSQSPLLRRRPVKDSEFIDVHDENGEEYRNLSANFLEEAYDEQVRKSRDENKRISNIIMKKSVNKRPKEPNMLTFNERLHMKFLHKSDPIEWNAEHLSQSFPALPWTIKKILKNKWVPEDKEKIKIMDEAVLENWKKLKENRLEASHELLEHLKKFIDKRDNLEIQLKNLNFFYLPKVEKKLTWKSGDLNSFLLKYEKEVESLSKNPVNVKLLPEKIGADGNVNYSVNALEKQKELVSGNEDGNCKDSFLAGEGMKLNFNIEKGKREKPVTLQELKENIFEKSNKKKSDLISPAEEAIIQKTLIARDPSKSDRGKILYGENESKCTETSSALPSGAGNEILEARDNSSVSRGSVITEGRRGKKQMKKLCTGKENFGEETEGVFVYCDNTFEMTDLGRKLFGAKDDGPTGKEADNDASEKNDVDASRVNVTAKNTKTPVNYFNSEKDKQVYEDYEKLFSKTVFWNARRSDRSSDAGLASVGTTRSPHVASHIQTYFAYDYPLKIEIPESKREKGKLYRVKDCYYDDSGEFLYRVPGMTE